MIISSLRVHLTFFGQTKLIKQRLVCFWVAQLFWDLKSLGFQSPPPFWQACHFKFCFPSTEGLLKYLLRFLGSSSFFLRGVSELCPTCVQSASRGRGTGCRVCIHVVPSFPGFWPLWYWPLLLLSSERALQTVASCVLSTFTVVLRG